MELRRSAGSVESEAEVARSLRRLPLQQDLKASHMIGLMRSLVSIRYSRRRLPSMYIHQPIMVVDFRTVNEAEPHLTFPMPKWLSLD